MDEELLDEVLVKLQALEVASLEEICVNLKLNVPANKRGKKQAVKNVIIRHLSSEEVEDSADGGEAFLNQLDMELGKRLKTVKSKSLKQEPESGGGSGSTSSDAKDKGNVAAGIVEIKYHKFREFKIAGQIGSDGEGLDYWSLSHQVREGKVAGFKYEEIRSGIIKAIKSGCSLRRYFESRPNISEEKLLQILQSHFDIKDSTSLFTELANAAQEPAETELNFVLRAMDLRNKIVTQKMKEFHSMSSWSIRNFSMRCR